jgi:hypothetical protein
VFAPYCSGCRSRVLLGVESVVAYDSADGRHVVVLRCHAGHLVDWDAEPPRPSAPRRRIDPQPVGASRPTS